MIELWASSQLLDLLDALKLHKDSVFRRRGLFCFLLTWPLLGSCVSLPPMLSLSVQPVVKIGLLAPFEGLHRRDGYDSLAAMRLALDSYQGQKFAMIPLALHLEQLHLDQLDGYGEETVTRTVAKLLADPDVKAVVGPYDPRLIAEIAPTITAAHLPWFLPMALDPTQVDPIAAFAAQADPASWATSLVQAVAEQAVAHGAKRLVLAGWQPGWPPPATLHEIPAALPLFVQAEPGPGTSNIGVSDALFWLGSPESGISFLAELVQHQVEIPFWFGPAGGDPIIPELFTHKTMFDSTKVFWVTWIAVDSMGRANSLETQSATSPHSLSPTAYLTYRATQAAIAALDHTYVLPTANWHVVHFALQADGTSQQLDATE